jgi:hypothetical protein
MSNARSNCEARLWVTNRIQEGPLSDPLSQLFENIVVSDTSLIDWESLRHARMNAVKH